MLKMAKNFDFSTELIFVNVVVLLLMLCNSLIINKIDDSLNLKCIGTFLNDLKDSNVDDTERKMINITVNVHIREKTYFKANRLFFVIVSYYNIEKCFK